MSKRIAQGRSASSLFLIELIVAVGFFAVASAVCLQLFVRARLLSVDSTDLSRATLAAQSAAEGFRAVDGSIADAARLFASTPEADGAALTLWYDAAWKSTTQQNAAFRLTLTADKMLRPIPAEITITRLEDTRELYSLSIKTPGDRGTTAGERGIAP